MILRMETEQTIIHSLEALDIFGMEFLTKLQAMPHDHATVIALSGDLGTGKTTFVQGVARALGVVETVTSPTFVIMKQYTTTDKIFSTLIHLDAYRIEDLDEMRPLGFSLLLEQPNTLICIEWAERIAALLPKETRRLQFTSDNTGARIITQYDSQNYS